MHGRLHAQVSERQLVEDSPWRGNRVELVDPNTQELVCRLAYRDAVVLAFEIEQGWRSGHGWPSADLPVGTERSILNPADL